MMIFLEMNNQKFHPLQVYNKNIKSKVDLVKKLKNKLHSIRIVNDQVIT